MSLLIMNEFTALDWAMDETGLFADNKRTGERILLDRFEEGAKNGIKYYGGHIDETQYRLDCVTMRPTTPEEKAYYESGEWRKAPKMEKWEPTSP